MVAQVLIAHGLCLGKVEAVVPRTIKGPSGRSERRLPVDRRANFVKMFGELAAPIKAVVCVRNRVGAERIPFAGPHAPFRSPYEELLQTLLPPWQIVVTHYESWFAAPYRELERVAAFVGLPMGEEACSPAPWSLKVASADEDTEAVVLPCTTVARPWHERKAA
jgi:hypothetical protein